MNANTKLFIAFIFLILSSLPLFLQRPLNDLTIVLLLSIAGAFGFIFSLWTVIKHSGWHRWVAIPIGLVASFWMIVFGVATLALLGMGPW